MAGFKKENRRAFKRGLKRFRRKNRNPSGRPENVGTLDNGKSSESFTSMLRARFGLPSLSTLLGM